MHHKHGGEPTPEDIQRLLRREEKAREYRRAYNRVYMRRKRARLKEEKAGGGGNGQA
jgi:hypothetical protein